MADYNCGIDGFLSPSNTLICRNYAVVSHQIPTILVLITEEVMEGTRDIVG